MLSIAVLSPDTVPLPLTCSDTETISINGDTFNKKDKCSRATSLGVRAWKTAEILSNSFSVTLYIPDINYPGIENIDVSKLLFDIDFYEYEKSKLEVDTVLQEKLEYCDVVIIQTNSGYCFHNCINLPKNILLISDGWTIPAIELPLSLMRYDEDYKRNFWYSFMELYEALLRRSDCILYNSQNHYYYYEALLFSIGKSNWNSTDCSNLIQYQYGVDINKKIIKRKTKQMKFLWYGPFYPWHDLESLFTVFSNIKDIQLDCLAVRHPRFSGYYDSIYKDIVKSYNSENIFISPDYCDSHSDLYNNYDCGIVISHEGMANRFSSNARTFDMISYGLPVVTNTVDMGISHLFYNEDTIYPTTLQHMNIDIEYYKNRRDLIKISAKSFSNIQKNLSWGSTSSNLINYLNKYLEK